MGAIYVDRELIDLYRFFGLTVNEVPGWEHRARSSGGFPIKCEAHWGHHTATGPSSDGWPAVRYATFDAPAKPVANEFIDRQGVIWIAAGGATNTEGAGGPWHHIGRDAANGVSWGTEVMNNGIGEPYPEVQQQAFLNASQIFAFYCIRKGWWTLAQVGAGIRNGTHFEWAPTRKIDLRGPSRWTGGANIKWDYNKFRQDVYEGVKLLLAPPPPPPPPPPPDDGKLPWVPVDPSQPEIVWVPDMMIREQGERVKQVQYALYVNQAPLPVDGDYGQITANHVKVWQQSHMDLPVTGVVDLWTARSLGFNAVPQPVPPPTPPPEPDIWIETNPFFYLWSGARWAFTVASQVWGNGNLYPHLEAANPTWPAAGQHVRVPNGPGLPVIYGAGAMVRPGDGPLAILRRIWPTDNPNDRLQDFYKWNGGSGRALQAGERVFIPD